MSRMIFLRHLEVPLCIQANISINSCRKLKSSSLMDRYFCDATCLLVYRYLCKAKVYTCIVEVSDGRSKRDREIERERQKKPAGKKNSIDFTKHTTNINFLESDFFNLSLLHKVISLPNGGYCIFRHEYLTAGVKIHSSDNILSGFKCVRN